MAMLAESRKKQKWSVDPRNINWSNDESRFGQKMLKKMGWSKGKGLGAHEQGLTENIKIKVKNNTVGLGAVKNHEDNWIAHQDEFNQLLSDLNDCHAQNGSRVAEDKTTFSLEEKSKSSKKRVHYQKFTKGKDLSSRSLTDLACIFGKRSKSVKGSRDQEEQVNDNVCFVPVEYPKAASATGPKVEANIVTSSVTVQEYFANRMAQLKKSKAGREIDQNNAAQELKGDNLNSLKEVEVKSKKKKKHSRGDAEGTSNFNELSIPIEQVKDEDDVELNNGLIEDSPIKEKKSRVKDLVSLNQKLEVESEEVQIEQYSAVNGLSETQNGQDWEEGKKKRKKSKKRAAPMDEDEVSQSCYSIERRKKKKEKK